MQSGSPLMKRLNIFTPTFLRQSVFRGSHVSCSFNFSGFFFLLVFYFFFVFAHHTWLDHVLFSHIVALSAFLFLSNIFSLVNFFPLTICDSSKKRLKNICRFKSSKYLVKLKHFSQIIKIISQKFPCFNVITLAFKLPGKLH